jgi:protein-S-isoprenylcysteine O-methyltransferase Ste14
MSTAETKTNSLFDGKTIDGKPDYWLAWEFFCNIALAAFFLYFVAIHGSSLMNAFRISTILILIKVSADVFFHLVRKPAKQITRDYYAWFIGIAGAFTILFFQPVAGKDFFLGTFIQLIGLGLQVAGMFSLNRSIGFVAANRGIKTGGMYKFVRHPLYFAYTVSFLGFLMNQFSWWNLFAYVLMVFCLYLRTRCEEEVLRQDDEYQAYAETVKYRMVPGLF